MDKTQYKTLNNKAKQYRKSLDINEVKKEFISNNLLNQNKKLSKGELVNFGLELTPSKFSQQGNKAINNCGNEGQCLFTCLAFSGVDNMFKSKTMDLSNTLKKRIRRDFLFKNDKYFFITKLKSELELLNATYKKVAIRLNVFSDIDWLDYLALAHNYDNITFYDYTKKKELLNNRAIHKTYSASEKDKDIDLIQLLKIGFNVAMVFNKLPTTWNNFKVIDGDIDDNRYKDERGVIVGLKQKTTQGGKTDSKFIRKA